MPERRVLENVTYNFDGSYFINAARVVPQPHQHHSRKVGITFVVWNSLNSLFQVKFRNFF